MQPTVVVGVDWTLYPWHHNSSNVGGVTVGQVRHTSSTNKKNAGLLVYIYTWHQSTEAQWLQHT